MIDGTQTQISDPLMMRSGPRTVWTSLNGTEAMPGVATPLAWTFLFPATELGAREGFFDLGVFRRSEIPLPPEPDGYVLGMFCGRLCGNLTTLGRVGDRVPGSSAEAVERQFFPSDRNVLTSRPERARYPFVLTKLPVNGFRARARIRAQSEEMRPWWRSVVAPGAIDTLPRAQEVLATAMARSRASMRRHILVSFASQGFYEQIRRLCENAGRPGLELRLLSNDDDVSETRMVGDLWALSRGSLSIDDFLAVHGYHGPGLQLHAPSWREAPSALDRMLEGYRSRSEDQSPDAGRRRSRENRQEAQAELRAVLSRPDRLRAKVLLQLYRSYVSAREEARSTLLQAGDAARAAARVAGEHLSRDGVLAEAADVFYLTTGELLGPLPADTRNVVAFRRQRRAEYELVTLPSTWTGQPSPIPVDTGGRGAAVAGLGVSPGTAEGRVRVIDDVAALDVFDPGEILVCPTTDPSWASLFFLAAAVVIDVGGPMSHGAIVSRELGIPCVINTRCGTRELRTGDLVRVDGTSGSVELLPDLPATLPAD